MEDPALSSSADDSDTSPQIQSNIEGDGNQAIFEMKGGTAINRVDGNVFIHNYYHLPIPIDSAESAEIDQLPCPYRGLSNFEPGDAKYFFGRESFVEELVQAMQTRNFIPLLGASGSGKSSVVLAGLVPKLQEFGHWQFTHFRPGAGEDPFHALALALVPLYVSNLDETERIRQARNLAGYFRTREVLLADVFAQIQQNFPTDRVLLIADQFEELYTSCSDDAIRRNFLDQLIAGIAVPTAQMPFAPVLVATMRADFLGNALSYRPFADILQNADLKLGPMNRSELTEIIEKPAQMLGVTFEAGLVKRILDDVGKESGILPLLEFALTELWKRRSNKQLTHTAYGEIGEVQGALDLRANQEHAKFSEVDRERVKRIFIQLVRPGEGVKDTRRIATKGELGEDSWSLVEQLATARLVVTSRNASGQETVEVVHEALIRNWGELRGWMEIDRVFRAWQERLRAAMQQWETHKDEGSLLRGAALAEAEEQLKERPEELVSESEFIKLSLQEQNRMQQIEISLVSQQKRIKQSEVAERVAQQERIEQAKEARKKHKLRIIWISILSPLVMISAIIGINESRQAYSRLYDEFAYCPIEKRRPGEKIKKEKSGEIFCFRNLVTSGQDGIFLSSTNHHLKQGVDAFKKEDYPNATKLFERAINADFLDPISRIFWQNAKARVRNKELKPKGFKSTIIKLAVVTSIDYYEKAATDVLRGVSDAQYKFNDKQGNDKPLIEIIIANDENEPVAAKKIARTLVEDEEIIGIIGHHSSESTDEAQKIYKPQNMPIISSTSSSSDIKGGQFFRTVKGTDDAAKKYADHIRNELKSNKVIIFYAKGSKYSEDLTTDFRKIFKKPGREEVKKINITSDFDAETEIKEITKIKKIDVVLIFTSVRTNSVAIEITKAIQDKNTNDSTKIQVLGNMALSEQETIAKGGNYIDGLEVVKPCLSLKSDYMKKAAEEWTQKKAEINWRHATSYDAAQAFIQTIKMINESDSVQSKEINRKNILSQLKSSSFSVAGKDTSSGLELKWGKGEDHPNENAKYCLAKIKDGKFEDTDKF